MDQCRANKYNPFNFSLILRRAKYVFNGDRPVIRILLAIAEVGDHGATSRARLKKFIREVSYGGVTLRFFSFEDTPSSSPGVFLIFTQGAARKPGVARRQFPGLGSLRAS